MILSSQIPQDITPLIINNGTATPNPWDETEDTVILATAKPLSDKLKQLIQERRELDLSRRRRDPWLGSGFREFNP